MGLQVERNLAGELKFTFRTQSTLLSTSNPDALLLPEDDTQD